MVLYKWAEATKHMLTVYLEKSPNCTFSMIESGGHIAAVTFVCQWISSALLEYSDFNPADS